jgi:hypothetical protein
VNFSFKLLWVAFVQIATAFVLLVVVFLGYAGFATHSARGKAEALCKNIPVGTEARVAETAIASIDTDPRLRFSSADHLSVGFYGALLDRWFCNVSISGGKVIENEVRLID